ncbi:MAG: PorP/SprF family type IX secretion system membrane protein [Bacteroidota bacterium]
MKNKIKAFLPVLTACCLLPAVSYSQDIHFSQFSETQSLLNPAMTGVTTDIKGVLNYRNQWKTVASPYSTFGASAELRNKKEKFAYGLNFYSDKAGDASLSTLQGNINLAGHIPLNERNKLSGGLYIGFAQRSVNPGVLKWESQYNGSAYDPNLASGEVFAQTRYTYPDAGIGLAYSFGQGEMYIRSNDAFKFNIGFSLHHLNRPKLSFLGSAEKMDMKYLVNGGLLIGIKNTPLDIVPSFMYAMQGPARELIFGGMLKYMIKEDSKYTGYVKGQFLSLGAFYRNKDALILAMMLEIGQYAIGISYDVNTSTLKNASDYKGGFEIALRFISPSDYVFKSSARFK